MKVIAFAMLLLGGSTGFAQTLSGLCMLSQRTEAPEKAQLMLARTDCDKGADNCSDMNNSSIEWSRWMGVSAEMLQKEGTTLTARMSAEPAATRGGDETVLLVEDDSGVRVFAARVLRQLGYTVLEAKAGGEALRVASAHEGRIDLLLTDVVMPQLSGSELAAQLLGQDPELKIIYMSGYTEDRVVQDSWAEVGVAFLSKPFSGVELAQLVRTTLDGTG